ncbi:glycosyl hydrolase 2 galactose-binding domain-containing protein [Amycolatopsis marina]|uniref:glycosyl hydrolase 2 galactose-binding domain-containing protein n=1 Tax=Amycolatopsis marina TaxID=490629 RepID=UPI0015A6536F|nr:sugar-binding domain-containing protein [Amycolatopsis marina]
MAVLAVTLLAGAGPAAFGQQDDEQAAAGSGPGGFLAPHKPGQSVRVPDWRLASSSATAAEGDTISRPGFADREWLRVPARSTVLAGLVAAGRYPDLKYSTNLRDAVDPADFAVPWWYRRELLAVPKPGTHTFLRFNGGVISRGEVWFNGTKLAGTDEMVGAYPMHEFDVTHLLRPGRNAIAVKAMPADPFRDLTVSFLDWSPPAPDNNMGIWRDVELVSTGPVSLLDPRALPELEVPALDKAAVTVKAEVRNNTTRRVAATVRGRIDKIDVAKRVSLEPEQTRTVEFTPAEFAQLNLRDPKVWWPAQLGGQPRYRLSMSAEVGGTSADRAERKFGIRDVRSELTPQGYREFFVNGKPFGARGGGWSSDLFLRTQPERLADQLEYVRDLGLNTIRLEGKQEDHELLEHADQMGIMLMPGWECCTKWEAWAKKNATHPWTEEDSRVAAESGLAEARRMVNSPSILGFFIGSDNYATAEIEKLYLDAFAEVDFRVPVLPSAARRPSTVPPPPLLGEAGMKMDGPYWWVPPNYWYGTRLGGNYGFASEVGSGPMIPELDSLRKFLTEDEITDLWRNPDQPHYHLAKKEVFSTLTDLTRALEHRYGPIRDLEDFLRKAQLSNYEGNRAQFEAYGRDFGDPRDPATGVIYWMLNNPWPTLYWHLFDHTMGTNGSYYGAKTALRPVHVQYSYDDSSVAVVNTGPDEVSGLTVRATQFDVDGRVLAENSAPVQVGSGSSQRALAMPKPADVDGAYFLRLVLEDARSKQVDRNVYWLSTKDDVVDHSKATWWHSPTVEYADMTELQDLPGARVVAENARTSVRGGKAVTEVTVRNTSAEPTVGFFLRASLRKGANGTQLTPATWSDNYVTLWPGEKLTLRAEYDVADLGAAVPHVQLSGWNVQQQEVVAPLR